jgi:hypothetical protein
LLNKEISEKEQLRLKLLNNRERKNVLDINSKDIENQIRKIDEDVAQIHKVLEIREKYASLIEDIIVSLKCYINIIKGRD